MVLLFVIIIFIIILFTYLFLLLFVPCKSEKTTLLNSIRWDYFWLILDLIVYGEQ